MLASRSVSSCNVIVCKVLRDSNVFRMPRVEIVVLAQKPDRYTSRYIPMIGIVPFLLGPEVYTVDPSLTGIETYFVAGKAAVDGST